MLICFLPLTLLCVATFTVAVFGSMPAMDGLVYLSVAAIGPIGLAVAFKVIVLERSSLGRVGMAALCVPAAWTVLAYILLLVTGNGTVTEWWREFILIAVLPAVGSAHLIFIARARSQERAVGSPEAA
jgi:hypothetical protein